MIAALMALLATLQSLVRSRLDLQAEIFALRHQLAVLQREVPHRPRLRRADRLVWVLLSRLWPDWRRAIHLVTPDTVVRWHRRAFALAWRWKSRPRRGRPALDAEVRALELQRPACVLRDSGLQDLDAQLQQLRVNQARQSGWRAAGQLAQRKDLRLEFGAPARSPARSVRRTQRARQLS